MDFKQNQLATLSQTLSALQPTVTRLAFSELVRELVGFKPLTWKTQA
ncbi:hypothetical protein [Levilactobacillus yonginensis]